jgi:hypothetical protein
MTQITTTLNRIREHSPCKEGWTKLLKHLGKTKADDEVLPFAVILESNGLDDALWCCRVEPQHSKEWRLFAVRCARSVQHLMTNRRSIAALDVAERHANGLATDAKLTAARGAARGAARAAARESAWAAAWAAAWETAWGAAETAAKAAADTAAEAAADTAADTAAEAAAWDAMSADFLQTVEGKS